MQKGDAAAVVYPSLIEDAVNHVCENRIRDAEVVLHGLTNLVEHHIPSAGNHVFTWKRPPFSRLFAPRYLSDTDALLKLMNHVRYDLAGTLPFKPVEKMFTDALTRVAEKHVIAISTQPLAVYICRELFKELVDALRLNNTREGTTQ